MRTLRSRTLSLFVLARDWVSGPITCRANWSLVLHPGGGLKECKIAGTATFDGLVLKDSVALHANGRLKKCSLGEPIKQGEKEIPAGTLLCFDESGAPKEPCGLMTP